MIDINKNEDGTFEVNAKDLYELVPSYFDQKIKVKESFIVNKKRYTLHNNQAQTVPISHSGIDLEKYANGKFLCKNDVPFHITIIEPIE